MRNRWIVYEDAVLSWHADLPRHDHAALTRWQRTALRLGAQLRVYRVDSVEEIGFDRTVHGPLDAFLDAYPSWDDGVLLFDRTHRATSLLAVADAAGEIIEREVADLGEVLAAAPHEAAVRRRPPLLISAALERSDMVGVTISTYSDVWLPWVSARFEGSADIEDFADNTALAARHTPRLNTLLARLRAATVDAGGVWALDRTDSDRDLLFEVDDGGVLLAAGQPFLRAYAAPAQGLDRDGVLAALRRAARFAAGPPPPPFRPVLRATVTDRRHELYTADRAQLLAALRRPIDPDVVLRRGELPADARIDVDNRTDRHTFDLPELCG